MRRFALLASLSLASLCLSAPVAARQSREPLFDAALPPPPAPPRAADGAIFNAAAGYAPLVEGLRARAVGDPLTVQLVENVAASKTAGSKTQRSGGASITPPAAGLLSFLNPEALKASSQASFNGQGNATQTATLAGEISVTIAEVRANGTALVRGEKRMELSQGKEWVQFSGIVRLADISADNRIASTRVADARMVYSGKGSIQRASREGWLGRFFSKVSPF